MKQQATQRKQKILARRPFWKGFFDGVSGVFYIAMPERRAPEKFNPYANKNGWEIDREKIAADFYNVCKQLGFPHES